ncbi:hypothetical protein [Chryseobacterium polytrichastri]|uniref:Uncharacterized protein n=1 Tax=Chryseobacterium polytrichastri TaxID=1302687 RepID=A0A1M7EI57_9FLAO|nr:hypothetical protein [Chryseobacterium polytrichastri]SHL91485.1 hypothetical protein SAMN05444267_102843 [Chryseobacterium polytrichastri]
MKNIFLILITITLLNCNNNDSFKNSQGKTVTEIRNTNPYKRQQPDNSKYHTKLNTVLLLPESDFALKLGKKEFNKIVDSHPEFFQDIPENPDKQYYRFGNDFESEAGKDSYFILYAYFLKQKNGSEKYAEQRKKLINIYSNINSLFQYFEDGGTYFGHQYSRILGYAEYSIYLYPKNKDEFYKTYDISKQKELYIKSLRQLVEDENKIDFESTEQQKIELTAKMEEIVNNIDQLITDNFYLRRAQEFQYGNYEYY